MTEPMVPRQCQCGPKALKDGARCAKCGKPIPTTRRPRPPMLPEVRGVEPTEITVDEYAAMLDRAEREDSSRVK